jgi:Protein of unknown function (DUF1573)
MIMVRWIGVAVLVVAGSASMSYVLYRSPHAETAEEGTSEAKPGGPSRAPAPPPTGPFGKLQLEGEPEFDFGKMAFGDSGSHVFAIKNEGDGNLTVARGPASCGCTVAELGDTASAGKELSLKPGEATSVTIRYTPKHPGKFQNQAGILTNDPSRREVSFRITGEVFAAFTTVPPGGSFTFPRLPNDELTTTELTLSSVDKPDFRILGIDSSRPEVLTATYRELSEEEKAQHKLTRGYHIDIALKPSPELGVFREELLVTTDHPTKAELLVPVSGKRVGAISATPDQVRFQAAAPTGGRGMCVLSVRGQGPTRFEVIEKPENLAVQIEPIAGASGPTRTYRLTASLPPGTPPGRIDGSIVLKTDHPAVGVFKIPLSVAVRRGD